mmetsp:Transcript_75642/g.210124  ORF Transcript_75642/g.210124 Transcript_75642/m.210124 type:complete len:212 (-) Transcript_75642:194-829(-)
MNKYDRFGACASASRGHPIGPTVTDSNKQDALIEEFKSWFVAYDGFGPYLETFFQQHGAVFDEFSEEHLLVYTQLHIEFSDSLERAIADWRCSRGLADTDFGDMLSRASARGDMKSDEVIGVLLGMLDYELWIKHIFALKAHHRLIAATLAAEPQAELSYMSLVVPEGVTPGQQLEAVAPDGQRLFVSVPEGVAPGEAFSAAYIPIQHLVA